jgi:hypothetical protein
MQGAALLVFADQPPQQLELGLGQAPHVRGQVPGGARK